MLDHEPSGEKLSRSGNQQARASRDEAKAVTRHFTVAVFVVSGCRTLLLYHRAHKMWLPPGGHIEPGETPDEASVREVFEETGLEVTLVGERGLALDQPRQLAIPEGVQLETIGSPSDHHEHVDLVYFAAPLPGQGADLHLDPHEVVEAGWYSSSDLTGMDLAEDVRMWALRALRLVPERLSSYLRSSVRNKSIDGSR